MSVRWYASKCSPKIILSKGISASGARLTTTYSIKKILPNTWDSSSLKSNMNNILEEIYEADIFEYPVYQVQCVNTYNGEVS